jgi:hypothetical protein
MIPSGAVFFILISAVLLAAALAWVVAALYQRGMLALMRGGVPPAGAMMSGNQSALNSAAQLEPLAAAETNKADLGTNHHASIRLMLVLSGISLLIALTQSYLALLFIYENDELTLNRVLLLGAIYAWPMVLAWGLARRWSWLRVLGGVILYMLVMLVLVMARSTEAQNLASASGWLGSQVAIPMTIIFLIGASGRIRAVAPYLLAPSVLLTGSSVLTLQVMARSAHNPAPWVIGLVGTLGAYPTLLLFALGPWLILAWPVFSFGKWLANAYRSKRFSDQIYLIATYWFVILFASALPAMESVGWLAFVQVPALLWIPLVLFCLRGHLKPRLSPPTLLVLRVFQRDAQVERLFDQVIERWRLSGNTVLIAGTDQSNPGSGRSLCLSQQYSGRALHRQPGTNRGTHRRVRLAARSGRALPDQRMLLLRQYLAVGSTCAGCARGCRPHGLARIPHGNPRLQIRAGRSGRGQSSASNRCTVRS